MTVDKKMIPFCGKPCSEVYRLELGLVETERVLREERRIRRELEVKITEGGQ